MNDPATLTTDVSGNSNTLTDVNNVGSVNDSTYGTAASFTNAVNNYFILPSAPATLTGSSSRTFSYWIKYGIGSFLMVHGQGLETMTEHRVMVDTNGYVLSGRNGISSLKSNETRNEQWVNISITYDGTTESMYFDGILQKTANLTFNTETGPLWIGNTPKLPDYSFEGRMLDFRIYDGALSSTDVTALYMNGPNPALTPAPGFLSPTAGMASISITVGEVPGALVYQINVTESSSGITRVAYEGVSAGDYIINLLTPETTYVLHLYADTGSGYQLQDTETVTTVANTPDNYDISVYGNNGKFDLSGLGTTEFALLQDVINDVFTTGDTLEINLGTTTSKVTFVNDGHAVSTNNSILLPFGGSSESGQAITINLSDASTVSVTYNEVNNSLSIDGSTYQVGDSMVFDGKKMTVKAV